MGTVPREDFKARMVDACYEYQVHGSSDDLETLADENDRLRAERDECVALLQRIAKYAHEDRMTTPRATRLARAIEQSKALVLKISTIESPPQRKGPHE